MTKHGLVCATFLALTAVGCGSDDGGSQADGSTGAGTGGGSADSTGGSLPEGCDLYVEPGEDDQTALATAFVDAADGSTVCLGAGTFTPTRQLTIEAADVTLKGAGADMTILDFAGQQSGGNGILIKSDNVTVTDLQVKNTPGDGIRADQVTGISFIGVHVIWDAMHSLDNGAYGLYPVQSDQVLIRNCEVAGARDAGIYVGQSTNIVVEDSVAHDNVAGIEIENSTDAIVRNNESFNNTGGVLIFNLPGLDVKDGKRANVYGNEIHDNNVENFADKGTIVGKVPAGVGLLVLAADANEIHDNQIHDNVSVGAAIIAYSTVVLLGQPAPDDPDYDTYSEGNYIHSNTFTANGTMPADEVGLLIAGVMPTPANLDIVVDGCFDAAKDNADDALTNCIADNGDAAVYVNADVCSQNGGGSTDQAPVTCMHDPLPTE